MVVTIEVEAAQGFNRVCQPVAENETFPRPEAILKRREVCDLAAPVGLCSAERQSPRGVWQHGRNSALVWLIFAASSFLEGDLLSPSVFSTQRIGDCTKKVAFCGLKRKNDQVKFFSLIIACICSALVSETIAIDTGSSKTNYMFTPKQREHSKALEREKQMQGLTDWVNAEYDPEAKKRADERYGQNTPRSSEQRNAFLGAAVARALGIEANPEKYWTARGLPVPEIKSETESDSLEKRIGEDFSTNTRQYWENQQNLKKKREGLKAVAVGWDIAHPTASRVREKAVAAYGEEMVRRIEESGELDPEFDEARMRLLLKRHPELSITAMAQMRREDDQRIRAEEVAQQKKKKVRRLQDILALTGGVALLSLCCGLAVRGYRRRVFDDWLSWAVLVPVAMLAAAALDGYSNGDWFDWGSGFFDSLRWAVFVLSGWLIYRFVHERRQPALAVLPVVMMLLFRPFGERVDFDRITWVWLDAAAILVLCWLTWDARKTDNRGA